MTDLSKELEKALSGKSKNAEVAPLAETAEALKAAFSVDVPEARSEQLLFTHGAGRRRHSGLGFRLLVPAVAVGSFLLALVFFGRTADPGGALYPVRGALKAVGLAEGPVEEVEEEINEAQHDLLIGERLLPTDPEEAADHAFDALDSLEDARELLEDLNGTQRVFYKPQINTLYQRARDLIAESVRAGDRNDDNEGPSSSEDNSGPGGGGEDDNSGSGSDDSGDNSGPGSGDSDGDSSGSGSGDDSDSSGSGSGDGDSSGSGSSGSGSGDSSGSGSDSSGSGSSGSG